MPTFSTDSLQGVPEQLLTLLTDPSSNLAAALTLYGIVAAALLVVLIIAIMWLMSTPEDEDLLETESVVEEASPVDGAAAPPEAEPSKPQVAAAPPRPKTARSLVVTLLVIAGVVLAAWVIAGFTTSQDAVCTSCHVDTVHSQAPKKQPHAKTACVACHEPGGQPGRYFGGVPSRLAHFVEGWAQSGLSASYGSVTQSACSSCHADDLEGVSVNKSTGIRMSHAEPLAASATCTDCHIAVDGVVASHNAGMNPCLRCHDSKTASAACDTCHDKKAAAAARARRTSYQAEQVTEIKCGGCHNEKKECDSCHGTRMPHSNAFKAGGHARAGAVNFWYEGGKNCSKCHTAQRRPCTKCHSSLLGQAHPPTQATLHQKGTSSGCDACHKRFATSERDFCRDVCHSEAAIAESPR